MRGVTRAQLIQTKSSNVLHPFTDRSPSSCYVCFAWMLVNLKTVVDVEQWKSNEKNEYIGRKTDSFEKSKWANPFLISRTNSREQAVSQFQQYILANSKLLQDLHELKGKNLGCWCFPKLCHGNILLKLLKEITSGEQQRLVSVMSNHDHVTRLSTGSLSSKGNSAKGTPPSKAQTPTKPTKPSIFDLSVKIDQQNTLIQQLLEESKENKENCPAPSRSRGKEENDHFTTCIN